MKLQVVLATRSRLSDVNVSYSAVVVSHALRPASWGLVLPVSYTNIISLADLLQSSLYLPIVQHY